MSEASTSSVVQPRFGPSLPQLLRGWFPHMPVWVRVLLVAAVAAIPLALVAIGYEDEITSKSYTQTAADARSRGLDPISFNFEYSRGLRISKPPGTYVQLERTRNGELVGRMTIRPIAIEPRKGLASGYLPLAAVELERQARARYPGFRLQFEGRSRVNFAEGYQFAFNARLEQPNHKPRRLLGRVVLIAEPYDFDDPAKPYPDDRQAERGVLVTLLSTTLDTSALAQDVGDTGVLKQPFRSFRFGE